MHSAFGRKGSFFNKHESSLCFKFFVVVTVVLAVVLVIIGILALMASRGWMPTDTANNLSTIGEVNSFVMISGGCLLFLLGLLAWSCQIHKDNFLQPLSPRHTTVVRRLDYQ